MPLTFYPNPEDVQNGSIEERIEVLTEAAERYKAAVMDVALQIEGGETNSSKRTTPSDLAASYNWEEIASVLSEVREMAETTKVEKQKKADLLTKLAEIYEVLRGAKMSKLEAVRLALISEANQLQGGATRIA